MRTKLISAFARPGFTQSIVYNYSFKNRPLQHNITVRQFSSTNTQCTMEHLKENSHDESGLSKAERQQVHENRMDRPPYARDPKKEFKKIYDGACFCGKVKFELGREKPLAAKFCHCGVCQLLHGAPFQWVIPSVPPSPRCWVDYCPLTYPLTTC